MNATLSYTDFDGVKKTIEVEVSVDLQEGPINSGLEWNEKKLVLRHAGKIVGRKGLCYREVERKRS